VALACYYENQISYAWESVQPMIRLLYALVRSEDGATLIEYALVVALIAIVCILSVTKLGSSVGSDLSKASQSI
jgi:pilus assembly protein Flp/PilA